MSAAPPRIAILTPTVWAPEREHFSGAMRALSSGLRGDVFTSSDRDEDGRPFSSFRLFAVRNDAGRWFKVRRFLLQSLRAWREHRREPYAAVVAYDPYASGIAAWILSALTGAALIIEMNGDYHEVAPGRGTLKGRVMRGVMQWTFARADGIRVLNESQATWVRHRFPGALVFKHPEYVALTPFRTVEAPLGDYLLSVGFPFQLKGVDLLIAAFREIADEHPQLSLRIMGYATEGELVRFRSLADGHPRVVFVKPGWVGDVAAQMSGAYALVNAARTEALGRVHVEAMAAARPVVASRTNGAQECVLDGETGVLFDVGDARQLAVALRSVLADRTAARRMGELGRARVDDHFTEAQYGERVTSMVARVCEIQGAGR